MMHASIINCVLESISFRWKTRKTGPLTPTSNAWKCSGMWMWKVESKKGVEERWKSESEEAVPLLGILPFAM